MGRLHAYIIWLLKALVLITVNVKLIHHVISGEDEKCLILYICAINVECSCKDNIGYFKILLTHNVV
jgi:hypothetical protein